MMHPTAIDRTAFSAGSPHYGGLVVFCTQHRDMALAALGPVGRELAELLGFEDLFRVLSVRGGTKYYAARQHGDRLRAVLGDRLCDALTDWRPAEVVLIPTGESLLRLYRRHVVRRRVAEGTSRQQVALDFRLHVRTVERWCSEAV